MPYALKEGPKHSLLSASTCQILIESHHDIRTLVGGVTLGHDSKNDRKPVSMVFLFETSTVLFSFFKVETRKGFH